MMTWLISMNHWLRTFLEKKGIDREAVFRLESEEVIHIVTLETVEEYITNMDANAQEKVKEKLLQIDLLDGNILLYLQHIAHTIVGVQSVGVSHTGMK